MNTEYGDEEGNIHGALGMYKWIVEHGRMYTEYRNV